MYLKIKDMTGLKLFLDLTSGIYTIGIQVPALKIGNGDYMPIHTDAEILEEYGVMDYKIEEMVERYITIYNLLNEDIKLPKINFDDWVVRKTSGKSCWDTF